VALDPQSSSAHYLRGQVLLAMNHRADARRAFDEALRLKQATRDELERKISGQHPSDRNWRAKTGKASLMGKDPS
jgi:hypothetical protein